jgi:hypothetical protein
VNVAVTLRLLRELIKIMLRSIVVFQLMAGHVPNWKLAVNRT